MTDFEGLIRALVDESVDFILVGGVAAAVHGSARLTQYVDVVYARSPENRSRLVRALGSRAPYLRGAPPGLPFVFDERAIERGRNFTLATALGDVDLLGEITGGGRDEDPLVDSVAIEVFGRAVRCFDLPALIAVKRAAGRPKDLEAIAELEAILEERKTVDC